MSLEFRPDFTYGHQDMMEATSRRSGAVQPDSVESDLAEWKRSIETNDKERVTALIERFLAATAERWLALAGHVAYYYLQTGEAQRAGDLYEEVMRRNPRNTEACYMAFLARLRQGDMNAARIHLSQVLDCSHDLSDEMHEHARGYEWLLVSDSPESGTLGRGRGRFLRWLAERLLPGPDSALRGLSLALWQRKAGARPRAFLSQEHRHVDEEEACVAITRVREMLARVGAARGAAPLGVFQGSVKAPESRQLYSLVKLLKPKTIVQVGGFVGYSACILGEACRRNGQGVVHCIDPNASHRTVLDPAAWADDLVGALGLSDYVRFYRGTFATPLWLYGFPSHPSLCPPVVGAQVLSQTGPADFIFVDGDHSVSATLADLVLAAGNLAPGGKIVLHDTNSWPQVRIAVSAFLSENRAGLKARENAAFLLPYGRRRVCYRELCPDGIDGLGLIEFTNP